MVAAADTAYSRSSFSSHEMVMEPSLTLAVPATLAVSSATCTATDSPSWSCSSPASRQRVADVDRVAVLEERHVALGQPVLVAVLLHAVDDDACGVLCAPLGVRLLHDARDAVDLRQHGLALGGPGPSKSLHDPWGRPLVMSSRPRCHPCGTCAW